MSRPPAAGRPARIAITMGDPAGVGPEIICRALAEMPPGERAAVIVAGDPRVMARAAALVGADLRFAEESGGEPGAVAIAPVPVDGLEELRDGAVSAAGGDAAYRCVVRAAELQREGASAAMVTAPLNKSAMHAAGHRFEGHTELLAHLCGGLPSFMLLASERLSVIHVSTHVSLRGATERGTTERVLATIRTGHAHMREIGLERPRIAVAGLNPHSGEGGLFGTEEIERITPAIEAARSEGIAVTGPVPGDTVFYRAVRGEFDLVVAQYHDQGHIPAKLIAFDTTVNVTLGLPIRRVSVDHGTAFDIAWKGRADHTNMKAAIAYGRRMAARPASPAAGS
ncbi:4-hydroxythreonine-4-phosphate dehydrogenase PdxA [Arenibaculum pallidiluteum]|uniref:4-hydroxythreonine-4-phosphate dehydrogenase PdxA n=1 Tax=Arenibaculum pallidiluteum TaxID=2812559 RepID=UPI001A97174B|nr:4-hydroxythreonine-4-phosphate dehydrogenase PdxA [Arenibaculum pallidiluteum]